MNALFIAAKEVCSFISDRGWEFCIIGGLAVQYWGEPRTTLDADISLIAPWGEEEGYVSALLDRFEARITDAHTFALAHRVVLIRSDSGKDIDIVLGALPFEIEMVRRALLVEFAPDCILPCCTAEDLFIMKAFADRPRDWVDVEGIVARNEQLDTTYIMGHLAPLCALKEAPHIQQRAQQLLERA